jgi:ABC-type uncharacterized transport system fused permease/ATPase subunit
VLLLVVWIAVGVLAVVVLGSLTYLTLGALQRLNREASALERDLRPAIAQVQQAAARAARIRAEAAAERRS